MEGAATRAIIIEFGPEFDKRGYVYYNLLKNACNIVTYVFLSLLMTEDFLSCLGPMVKIYLDTWTNERSGHYMSNL